jgi:hypothetical protein
VWPDPATLPTLDQGPATAGRPGLGELPGAPPERDSLSRERATRALRPDVAVWQDPASLSAFDQGPGTAGRPGLGELPGAPQERDGLLRERAARPDGAVWPDSDSLTALSPRPGLGEPPGAAAERDGLLRERAPRPERDGPPRGSAAGPNPTAEPGLDTHRESPSAERPLSPSGTMLPDLPRPRPGNRPSLAAKLSLADLARVRQALALLSEEPATAAERTDSNGDGPVPSSRTPDQGVAAGAADRVGEDETDTVPMPVILHGSTDAGSSGAADTPPRAPFEPARPSQQNGHSEPESAVEPDPAESLPAAAAAKLDQIKDLLLTAEAIGEHNLDQHFEQVSQRQRELIREFFDQAMPGRDAPA